MDQSTPKEPEKLLSDGRKMLPQHENISQFGFKKGQSGNPAGRKKGVPTYKTMMKRWLAVKEKIRNPTTGELEELTQFEIILLAQMNKARKGSVAHFTAIMDRLEGRPMQKVEQKNITQIVAQIKPFNDIAQQATDQLRDESIQDIEHEDVEVDNNDELNYFDDDDE